ncbi:GTPase domain-containing protein [Actinacidiphila acididurans]|uniref:50S ribosome-binding GTPase n=1 Tax=Actinacidiphila acididurans TaxID=2784346 RepID=A0ABS2TXL4_9ACTN|nr:GTPase domain-containing protein [Actinacidiphila acididurans]MBM9507822.1 50S ribosome-binding GTPase [Actinacidiphila acididurans]
MTETHTRTVPDTRDAPDAPDAPDTPDTPDAPDTPDTPDPREWTSRVRAAVRTIAGDGFTEEISGLWHDFRRSPDVRVTVYGPYDAGKSSLIKRLLSEDATEPPPWLTVSARRETFTVDHVLSGGLEYADTPGIAGGNAQHEAVADNALSITDALLVVLPPQLATTDAEHIRAVATGTLFGPPAARLFPAGSLRVVVGRMDEAGIDPQDNPEGYRSLSAHKRKELAELLTRGAAGSRPQDDAPVLDVLDVPVHLVAADPYGFGLFTAAEAADGGSSRDWDGIAELRAALGSLVDRRQELRAAAEVRLWSRIAMRALGAAEHERAQAGQAVDEARRELAQLAAVGTELDGVVGAATAALRTAVHELLSTAVETLHGADLDHIRAEAERGLGDVLTRWSLHWGAELDRLVQQTDSELAARARRASATAFRGFVGTVATPPATLAVRSEKAGERSLDTVLRDLKGQVRWAVRGLYRTHVEKDLGMSLERAVLELARVDSLGGNRRRLKHYFRSGIGFANAEQAAAARSALQRMKIFDAVLPSVVELGTLLFREIQGARLERQEMERRTELRGKLDGTADAIVSRILTAGEDRPDFGWNTAVSEVRNGLDALAQPLRSLVGVLEARQEELAAGAVALTALLEQAPVGA